MIVCCQKTAGSCFLGWKGISYIGIHAIRDCSNTISLLQNTKELCRDIQNKRQGILISAVVLNHDNVRPYTGADTQALLGHFKWEFFGHPP